MKSKGGKYNLRYDLVVCVESLSHFIFKLPRFRILNSLKSSYLKLFFGAIIGKRVVFYPDIWLLTGRNLKLGDDVDLAYGVLLTTDGGLEIGDRTLIGYGTKILTGNHRIPILPEKIFSAGHEKKPVKIGKDVWIGANCIILPGVSIGDNSVIAGGAVVTSNVESGKIYGGVPAREISSRVSQ